MSERVGETTERFLDVRDPPTGRALVQQLLQRVDDGICEMGPDGRLRVVNDALLGMTGYERDALEGAPMSTLFTDPEPIEYLLSSEASVPARPIDVELTTAGQDTLLCEILVRPISSEGEMGGGLGIISELERPPFSETKPIRSTSVSLSVNNEGQIISVSTGVEELFDLSPEDLLDAPLERVLDRPDEVLHPSVESADAIEAIAFGADGREIDIHANVKDVTSRNGAAWVVSIKKIGSPGQDRFNVRDRTTKLGQIAKNIEEVVWLSPPDKSWMTYVNRAYETIWDRPREELYADPMAFLEGVHPDDRDRVRSALDAQKHGEYDEEYRVVQPDGSIRWVHDRAVPIRDTTGSVYRVVGIAKDITEHKRMANELREERDRMEGILDASPIGIVFVDGDGKIQVANACATDIFERSAPELESYLHQRVSIVDEFGEPIEDDELPHEIVLNTGECALDRVLGIRTPDGERVWISANAAPHGGGDGAVLAIEDITDRRELETELDEVLGRVSDAFYALDDSWRFTHANDRAEDLMDSTGDGLIGKHIWKSFEWAAHSRIREEFERAMRLQKSTTFEIFYPEPLNRWLEINAYPSTSGLSVYFRDISERKADQQELSMFRTLLDHSNDSILIIDPDSAQYLDVNRTACERRGYSREEFLEKSVMDLSSEVPNIETWEEMVVELREEGAQTLEGRHLRKDGSTYPIEFSASYLEFDQGYVIAIGRDISERKQRERRLERSERLYRTIAENYPNGIVTVYDEELRIMQTGGDIAGNGAPIGPHHEGECIDDILPESVLDEIAPKLESTVTDGSEGSLQAAFGDRQWQLWSTPLRDSGGEIFAGICFAQDITKRIERQRRLEASNAQLEQFAYSASHDLQEPLRMVSSYLQLIQKRYADQLDEDGEEFLEYAVDGAERMREMINGLLDYSRVATHAEAFSPIDLDAVLEDVTTDLHLQIEESSAEVTSDPLPVVHGDGGQLRQVFQNLLENALAYHDDDPPRIHVTAENLSGRAAITIRDDGIGIPPGEQARIFEVFQRLDPHGARAGTGIGLAICRRIIERHGGEISVDSEPGEGTAFTFTLTKSGDHGG